VTDAQTITPLIAGGGALGVVVWVLAKIGRARSTWVLLGSW
jgi:hypothetical protein